ncbi:hypothetical protein MD484_g7480, partial [Candolleomyces efflorescens]
MADSLDIEYFGRVIAKSIYGNICLSLVVVGIHLFMSLYGLSLFLEMRDDSKKEIRLYIVIGFMITIVTGLNASLEAAWAFKSIFAATSGVDYIVLTSRDFGWERRVTTACTTAMTLIGDSMLVYRCYIICRWKHRWWLSVLPALTCLSSLALSIFNQYQMSSHRFDVFRYTSAVTVLSVSTNAIVTGIIIFFLVRARRGLAKDLPSSALKRYTGVVALLVESALPVTLFGMIFAVVVLYSPKETTSAYAANAMLSYVFGFLFSAFTTLSPHMIIFKVTIGRSWVSRFPRVDELAGQGANGDAVAQQGVNSSFLQSVINRDLARVSSRDNA